MRLRGVKTKQDQKHCKFGSEHIRLLHFSTLEQGPGGNCCGQVIVVVWKNVSSILSDKGQTEQVGPGVIDIYDLKLI